MLRALEGWRIRVGLERGRKGCMMDLRFDQFRQVYLSVEHSSWLIGGFECEAILHLRRASHILRKTIRKVEAVEDAKAVTTNRGARATHKAPSKYFPQPTSRQQPPSPTHHPNPLPYDTVTATSTPTITVLGSLAINSSSSLLTTSFTSALPSIPINPTACAWSRNDMTAIESQSTVAEALTNAGLAPT